MTTYTDDEIKDWVRLMLLPIISEGAGGGVFKKNAAITKQLLDERDQARAALEKTASQLDVEHADYMLGKGRDPAKYVSQWSRAADSIRATLKGLGE